MAKIAIPTTPTIFPFLSKAISLLESHGFEIVLGTESEVEDLLHRNYVDLAFTTPVGYGKGVTKVDYRIIPTFALSLQGFTNIAGISFKPTATQLKTISSKTQKDFIVTIGKHLVEERYDCALEFQGNEEADVKVNWVDETNSNPTLDIGEEWEELYSSQLPIGFWVCRPDKMPEDLAEILHSVFTEEEMSTEVVENIPDTADHFSRFGAIIRSVDEKFIEGLEKVLVMLYYAQIVPEIPAVKFYDGTITPNQE
ncbi:MAG: hypothetical protein JNL36_11670 [Candidatus Kapabacteria bacterium]|nr:hypothetical protein [Candidatus Kapabacteria bacterium]